MQTEDYHPGGLNTERPLNPSVARPAGRSKKDSVITQDKLRERQACKNQLKEKFKSVDLFGQSINLTWNGEDEYKTMFGASISWVLRIVITAYLIYKFIVLVTRQNPDVTKTTGIRPPEDEEPFRPQEQGFDFAFGLRNYLDPSIGFFTVQYINQTVNEKG